MKVLLINGSPKKEGNTYTAMDKMRLAKSVSACLSRKNAYSQTS